MHLCEYVVVAAGDLNARWTVQSEQLAANWMGFLHLFARVETWGLGFGSLPYNPVARTSFNNYSPNLLKSFRNPFCWKHRPRVCSVLHRPALPGVCWLSVKQKNRRKLMLKFSRGRRRRSSLTDLNLESLNLEVLWCSHSSSLLLLYITRSW